MFLDCRFLDRKKNLLMFGSPAREESPSVRPDPRDDQARAPNEVHKQRRAG